MISKEQIIALSEGLMLLEDAKKAGIKLAAVMRSKPQEPNEKTRNAAIMDSFKEFKKSKKDSQNFSEKLAAQYFLTGFREAYDDLE